MPSVAGVAIRPFTPDDLDAVAHVHFQACSIAYRFMNWNYPEDEVLAWFRSRLPDWDWGLVGTARDEVVGYLLMEQSHLDHLFILPDWQGRGIGATLLSAALARPIRPITMDVFEQNRLARDIYERSGFRETRRWFNAEEQATELRYVLE